MKRYIRTNERLSEAQLKRLFNSHRVIEWLMDTANELDTSYDLDTPEKFSLACLDAVWDNLDEVNSIVGRTISYEELSSLSDWILDECSKRYLKKMDDLRRRQY